MCDNCIHDEVCGLEDNHEEAITFCADMIPKDIFDKIRADVINIADGRRSIPVRSVINILNKYKEESEKT
jgi:hypothetical protein